MAVSSTLHIDMLGGTLCAWYSSKTMDGLVISARMDSGCDPRAGFSFQFMPGSQWIGTSAVNIIYMY